MEVGKESESAAPSTVILTKVRAQFIERGGRDLGLIPHNGAVRSEPFQPKSPFTNWVLTFVRMTVCGADVGNLSPPAQLRVCSSSVSGMGGMSSVPCARERAELVRAWWVTASGSGVAICGDTGKKLDRPVPAGFETVPQGIRVNLRVRDASGITTKPPNADTMSAVHPAPLSSLQAHSAVEDLVLPLLQTHTIFPGSAQRCPGPTGRGSRFTPVGRSRICSLPAQAFIREKPGRVEKRAP